MANLDENEMFDADMDSDSDVEPEPVKPIKHEEGKETDLTKDKDKGAVKKILVPGSGWETPKKGWECHVRYTAKVGEVEVDASGSAAKVLVVGETKPDGLDLCLKSMKKGEKAELKLAAKYAFGSEGNPPLIPADAEVTYTLTMDNWNKVEEVKPGVMKKTLKEGKGWETPKDLWVVGVNITAKAGDEVVDQAQSREYEIGKNIQPPGLEAALKKMKLNEHSIITIAAKDSSERDLVLDVQVTTFHKREDLSKCGAVISEKLNETKAAWKKPKDGAVCKVSYVVSALPGLEEVERRDDAEIVLGDAANLECIDLIMESLCEGESAKATVRQDYAWSEANCPEKLKETMVDAEAQLQVELTLHSFTGGKEPYEMSHEEKLEAAEQRRVTGNALFKAGAYRRARRNYDAIVSSILSGGTGLTAEQKKAVNAAKDTANLNLAACHVAEGNWADALKCSDEVLKHSPDNIKALLRKTKALLSQDDLEEAHLVVNHILRLDANNVDAKKQQALLRKRQKEVDNEQRGMFVKMFKKDTTSSAPQPTDVDVSSAPQPMATTSA